MDIRENGYSSKVEQLLYMIEDVENEMKNIINNCSSQDPEYEDNKDYYYICKDKKSEAIQRIKDLCESEGKR